MTTSSAALVPAWTWRNVVLVAVAVLVLVVTGATSRLLRPQIFDQTWDKSLAVSPGDRTIVAILDGVPRVWHSATVTGVVAPRGTHVVGAWLMGADRARAELATRPGKGPADSPDSTWREVIDFPRVGPGTALPQTVHNGQEVMLAVVWRIDDCAAVTRSRAGNATVTARMIRWRTVIGTSYTSDADADLGPAGTDAVHLLRSAGVCP